MPWSGSLWKQEGLQVVHGRGDALLDPGKPTRSSTAPEVCQGHWAQSGAACPNSGFCLTVHKTAPTWDYNADSERVAHPDRSEARRGWLHLVPCPQARHA